MDMSLWGDIGSGALGLYGYSELMDDLKNTQGDINTTIGDLQQGSLDLTGFTPWGVTSNLGSTSVTDGGLQFNLSPEQQAQADFMRTGATDLFGYATQDPTARQGEFYKQLQAARQPALEQAYSKLNQNVYGTGTGGMVTSQYGGNPRDYAFGKALADSQAADMLQAQQMAQAEQMQQANIGQSMFTNQFTPHATNAGLMQYGINNRNLQDTMGRESASLWTQLGLGGLSTNVNYDTIRANAFGDMIGAATPLAAAGAEELGGFLRDYDWGGLWDGVTGLFGGGSSNILDQYSTDDWRAGRF